MRFTAVFVALSFLLIGVTAIPVSEFLDSPDKFNSLVQRYNSPTPLYPANQTKTDLDTFLKILNVQANPDPDLIKKLVAFDATYVSLSEDNPTLHEILPWAGTHYRVGPQAFIDTFTRVGLWWTRGPFNIESIFTDGQGNLTAWGTFEITSNTLQKTVTSPWSCRAVINSDGLISYFQYMEDTFATVSTFWAAGSKQYCADPFGGCVEF
ncbi:hypothetical protein F4803DRAFT_565773 [Xylaria telfairii]|nr:hypothetical protein F4803DRAFT_565773 [Xylaria telfairii]